MRRRRQDAAEKITAARVAAIVEAPETPPVLRSLLVSVCHTLDAFSAEPSGEGGDLLPGDYRFKGSVAPSADAIRRKLPGMLRKIGGWRVSSAMAELSPRAKKKGGDS